MSGRFTLSHAEARRRALAYVAEAPIGWVVTVKPAKRSNEANARLHAMLSDVARQVDWTGRKWETEDWKRFMVAAWMRTKNQQARMVPAIDGHGFDVLYHRTSELSGAETSELMSYVEAWGVENGVEFSEATA